MANKSLNPNGSSAKQLAIRIPDIDKKYLDDQFILTGVSTSDYVRQLIRMARQTNSKTLRLDEIERRVRKLKIELSFLESEKEDIINEIETSKTAADNRDQAIEKEIEALMPSLLSNYGSLKKIERFIINSVITLDNNFKSDNTNPLTVEEFTNMLRDHAESQGVSCL